MSPAPRRAALAKTPGKATRPARRTAGATPAEPPARRATPARRKTPTSSPAPAAPTRGEASADGSAPDRLAPRPVPPLTPRRVGRLPSVSDRTLDNGLRVLAVRRPGVPLVELRLRVPFAEPPGGLPVEKGRAPSFPAAAQLLADTLLSGTAQHTAAELAAAVQALGGQLAASTDADRLSIGGSVLGSGLPGLLALLGEVLTGAIYPKPDVAGERDRLVDELAMYRSQASVVAREAMLRRLYGEHPYGREIPTGEQVREVRAKHLRALHASRLGPAGSVLTVVGDQTPARLLEQVAAALSGWTSTGTPTVAGPLPPYEPRTALLLDRSGAVQTTMRISGPALSRTEPGYAALALANLVFGGYFSSRWVANIREDKGYTYSPHSVIEHPPAGSRLTLAADVATSTTAAALLETTYELGRMATLPVGQGELDQARRYAVGSLAVGTASQAGLASTLSQLAGAGLSIDWLREYPALLSKVTVEDLLEAGTRFFAPHALTTVLVGDVGEVEAPLRTLVELERG